MEYRAETCQDLDAYFANLESGWRVVSVMASSYVMQAGGRIWDPDSDEARFDPETAEVHEYVVVCVRADDHQKPMFHP